MSNKELDLDFEFSNDELANFLENFADKMRDGDVGLSFKGREEVRIQPTEDNRLDMEFEDASDSRQLDIKISLYQEKASESTEGRKKIPVEIV